MDDRAASFSTSGHLGEDRISALHDDLLGDIITRLPVTDAARTATLASRWRHLWRSTPLVLRDCDLPDPEDGRLAIVARVLADHKGPFHTIWLNYCSLAALDLGLLAGKGTQELSLSDKPLTGARPTFPRLPADIFRARGSLEKFYIAFLTLPDDLPRVAGRFPSLRELSLIRTATSDKDLDYLLAASPVLQTLVFICDLTPKRVHVRSRSIRCVIAGLSRVDEFNVEDVPLLERLILIQPPFGGADCVTVKMACATNLRVLGYLDPSIHGLQIGHIVIKSDAIVSPRTVVPSVRVLALKVNFGVLSEVKMLASFLRCFPNVATLHIQSVQHDPSSSKQSGKHHAKFWQDVSPVECLRSHVKSMVIHKFRGDPNEFEFLKFLVISSHELQSLLVEPPDQTLALVDKMNEMIDKLGCPRFRAWACKVLLVSLTEDTGWDIENVDLINDDDPFCQ